MQSLSKPIQSKINRLAHRQAIEFEKRTKSELTTQILKARTDGATFDNLTALLDQMEKASLKVPTVGTTTTKPNNDGVPVSELPKKEAAANRAILPG